MAIPLIGKAAAIGGGAVRGVTSRILGGRAGKGITAGSAGAGVISAGVMEEESPWRAVEENTFGDRNATRTMGQAQIASGLGIQSRPRPRAQAPEAPLRRTRGPRQPVSGNTAFGMYNRRHG